MTAASPAGGPSLPGVPIGTWASPESPVGAAPPPGQGPGLAAVEHTRRPHLNSRAPHSDAITRCRDQLGGSPSVPCPLGIDLTPWFGPQGVFSIGEAAHRPYFRFRARDPPTQGIRATRTKSHNFFSSQPLFFTSFSPYRDSSGSRASCSNPVTWNP
jgi:hypothetical protein